ncbi:MAG: site-specific integrase [Desulfuromonadaceae bacterium]|nr:site-specific integrase [Desulfuromonadaceae bacterium]MDD5106295.1 site-specific integrase [Desulfuromonadaceae bacterium]
MKMNLQNDLVVKNLNPDTKPYYCMSENKTEKGFGVLVYPSGTKTFIFKYKLDGVQKLLTLGEYSAKATGTGISLKDARAEYLKQSTKVHDLRKGKADGVDPVKEIKLKAERRIEEDAEHKKALTVSKLITEYITRYAKIENRNWKDNERLLNKEVLPEWGKRKAKDITKRDVNLLLQSIVDRGSPATSNQILKITRKMFTWAIEKDILENTPFIGVKAHAPNNTRERALTETEIKTFWNILDSCSISDEVKRALKLVLITAQRPGEVSAMHRGEIDGRWWTIPGEAIYTAQAKNHVTHRVYLTDTALELIGSLKMIDHKTGKVMIDPKTGKEVDKGYIFPCPHGAKEQPIETRALAHAVRRNLQWPVLINNKPVFDADGKPVTENRLKVEEFTPHDLRRSAATLMAKCKIGLEHRERVLNHKKGKLDATYNQYDFDDEKQVALETLERKIKSIISGKESNVVSINSSRKAA